MASAQEPKTTIAQEANQICDCWTKALPMKGPKGSAEREICKKRMETQEKRYAKKPSKLKNLTSAINECLEGRDLLESFRHAQIDDILETEPKTEPNTERPEWDDSLGGPIGAKPSSTKTKKVVAEIDGDIVVSGNLRKSLVKKIINRNINQIRYCYSREFHKTTDLAGKISITFVILKDGSVSKANVKESSMNNKRVGSCLVGRIKRFKFSQLTDDEKVTVTAPFVFKPE